MNQIINRYLEGKASAEEQAILLEWLRNKENRLAFRNHGLLWKKNLDDTQLSGEMKENWNKIQEAISESSYKQNQGKQKINLFFRYAAIFFFVVTLSLLAWYYTQSKTDKLLSTSVVAENGHISKIELPDGSLVWLNSGSKITYNNLFANKNRSIQLTGEAYFDIAHDAQQPLVVGCGELQVKVLGTRFNVAAYKENKSVDIVLEEGSVELLDTKVESFNYLLKPGERAIFSKDERKITLSNVNTAKFTSWKEGILNIYDQSLEQVVKKLETRYNQEFKYNDDVKDFRYTFTIKNEPLDEIIKLMEKITPVKAIQEDELILFQMDKSKMRESNR